MSLMLTSYMRLNHYGKVALRHLKSLFLHCGGCTESSRQCWEIDHSHGPYTPETWGQGGARHNLWRNLNKQKINMQPFCKLQHYGTVECINYTGKKKKRKSTVFTKFNSKKFRKNRIFFCLLISCTKLTRERKGTTLHTDIWLR